MIYAGAVFLVLGFIAVAHFCNAGARVSEAVERSRQSLKDWRNPNIDDETKERLFQQHAIRLFLLSLILLIIGVASAGLPALIIWLTDRLGWLSFDEVITLTLSWQFILAGTVAIIIGVWLIKSLSGSDNKATEFENQYSPLDRMLHKVVFATTSAQLAFSDMEDFLFSKSLKGVKIDRPVFITALPRAGTTMLLNILSEQPEFATHRYRNMPFVLCPLFWNRFSAPFRKTDTPRERAHGDGMTVSLDSPEAFEEMLWKAFWPKYYQADRINLWSNCDDQQFVELLQNHTRKLILLHDSDDGTRYLSKNNVNIARISAIPKVIDSAILLVSFRDPIQHAQSMLRQHLRFSDIHKNDRFAYQYMVGVGHFDFGAGLKPIDFDRWLDESEYKDTTTLAFWLQYWIAAYQYVLRHTGPQVRLIGYDWLCENQQEGIEKLAALVEIADKKQLHESASVLKPPVTRPIDTANIKDNLLDQAMGIFNELNQKAQN